MSFKPVKPAWEMHDPETGDKLHIEVADAEANHFVKIVRVNNGALIGSITFTRKQFDAVKETLENIEDLD